MDGKKTLASWEQLIGESILIEFKLSFAVNFSNGKSIKFQFILNHFTFNKLTIQYFRHECRADGKPELFDIISEGLQFEYQGFALNESIRMAVMRKV